MVTETAAKLMMLALTSTPSQVGTSVASTTPQGLAKTLPKKSTLPMGMLCNVMVAACPGAKSTLSTTARRAPAALTRIQATSLDTDVPENTASKYTSVTKSF